LLGVASWVGYYQSTGGDHPGLPKIRPGILTPLDNMHTTAGAEETIEKINLNYAKDYRIMNDLGIVIGGFRKLGRRTDK
jgi:hypothetical protein